MSIIFPKNFDSIEEYKSYCNCLDKVKPGDKGFLCVDIYKGLSRDATISTVEITFLGQMSGEHGHSILLMGSNSKLEGFWKIANDIAYITDQIKNPDLNLINQFTYGYWHYDTDCRIARIIQNA